MEITITATSIAGYVYTGLGMKLEFNPVYKLKTQLKKSEPYHMMHRDNISGNNTNISQHDHKMISRYLLEQQIDLYLKT